MAERAATQPEPDEDLVSVFETEQESEAQIVRGLLESAGIENSMAGRENPPDVLPVGGVAIFVREEDAEEARILIEDYRRTPAEEVAEEAEFDAAAEESPDVEGETDS